MKFSRIRIIFAVMFLFFGAEVFAQNILMAPVLLLDETGKAADEKKELQELLKLNLSNYDLGENVNLVFMNDQKYSSVNSILDVQKLCLTSGEKYAVYGYIQKNTASLFGNLKIYGLDERKILKEVFCADDSQNYSRFIDRLCNNLLEELKSIFYIEEIKRIENAHGMLVQFPINVFYWTPANKKWCEVMAGVCGAGFGVEIFPPVNYLSVFYPKLDFSTKFDLSYSFGMSNKSDYDFDVHKISVTIPVLLHLHLSDKNDLYFGPGLGYDLEFLNIQQKYKDFNTFTQNMFSGIGVIGFSTKVSQYVELFSEIRCKGNFSSEKYFEAQGHLGLKITAVEID